MSRPIHVEVSLREVGGNSSRLIKKFIKKVKKSKILEQVREKMFFEKPSKKRRREKLRKLQNTKKAEAPMLAAIETIGQIYEALAFPPISLENLRSYVYDARGKSVIIRNSTYSLLDDLAARGTIVLAWED